MKKLEKIYKLSEVLATVADFPWDSNLYVEQGRDWNRDSTCAVIRLSEDDLDLEETENPEFAKRNNLIYALTIATVQDIVGNARQQDPQVNDELLVKAFAYYYKRDTFADISRLE